jgi:hypothetical protein
VGDLPQRQRDFTQSSFEFGIDGDGLMPDKKDIQYAAQRRRMPWKVLFWDLKEE